MKLKVLVFLLLVGSLWGQNLFEGTFNCFSNVKSMETIELKKAVKYDKKDDFMGFNIDKALGDAVGVDQKAYFKTATMFDLSADQEIQVVKHDDGSYSFVNPSTKLCFTIEGNSMDDGAFVVPEAYTGAANQCFTVERDTLKHRYAFYLHSKSSNKVCAIDDKGRMIQQTQEYGKAEQIFTIGNRYCFLNMAKENTFAPAKTSFFNENVILNGKKSLRDWYLICHPNSPLHYYFYNVANRKFLNINVGEDGAQSAGDNVFVSGYARKGQIMWRFANVEGQDDSSLKQIKSSFSDFVLDIDDKGNVIINPDTNVESQRWSIRKASRSMF